MGAGPHRWRPGGPAEVHARRGAAVRDRHARAPRRLARPSGVPPEGQPMNESRNRWLILLVTCLGTFMIMLDTTIVYVATPTIVSGIGASLDQLLWIFN